VVTTPLWPGPHSPGSTCSWISVVKAQGPSLCVHWFVSSPGHFYPGPVTEKCDHNELVKHCAPLHCTTLHCTTEPHCTALHYRATLHCTALQDHTALHYSATLHCTTLQGHTLLHCTTGPPCTALHYRATLHCKIQVSTTLFVTYTYAVK